VVLNRVTYHPMEYNIRALIVEDEAKQYMQPATYGITKKIVDRFQVIRPPVDNAKWDFSYNIVGDVDKAEYFYVFETIDSINYRALTKNLTNMKIPSGIGRSIVNTLRNGCTPDRV